VQENACDALLSLSFNKEIQLKMIKTGFLEPLKQVMTNFTTNNEIQKTICFVIENLSTSDRFIQSTSVGAGFVDLLKKIITTHSTDEEITKCVTVILSNLSKNRAAGRRMIEDDFHLTHFKNMMIDNPNSSLVQKQVCEVLTNLISNNNEEEEEENHNSKQKII